MRKSDYRFRTIFGAGILFVALAFAAGAGAEEDLGSEATQLEASLKKWEEAREACGGNYSYSVRFSSFTGFSQTTTITVRDNKVIERKLERSGAPVPVKPGEKPPGPEVAWVEKGDELGSHRGVPPRTMDEMYAEAKALIDVEVPKFHRRSLAFDERGLLKYCFLVDTTIADDAPLKGVRPLTLQLGEKG